MKRTFILLGLLAALQLSAQTGPSNNNAQQPLPADNEDQSEVQIRAPHHPDRTEIGQPERNEQPVRFHGHQGKIPFHDANSCLSEKGQKTIHGYLKDLHKAVEQKENELSLRKAELRYLTHLDKPNMSQISGKLDEISKLQSTIQLETIKCRLKIKEQFPDFAASFADKPHHPANKPSEEPEKRLHRNR